MSDSITIARPYAKAVFEYALVKNKLILWSEYLDTLAFTVMDANAAKFINNPATVASQHSELLFTTVCSGNADVDADDRDHIKNLIEILAHNKRLAVLPEIKALYEAMRAEQEKTVTVRVSSYCALSSAQEQQLLDSLSRRLKRQVTLDVVIDKELIGGAVIHAGDLVIDGSVRGKINKLRTGLTA
jgi:F-type H+-transporting ATPase subunit delta